MKNLQLFETKAQAVGLEVETPYTATIDEQVQPVYGSSTLGEKVTLIKDANDIVVCSIKELSDEGYVDLGLPSGRLWASCNLGASSPCEYGNYYAWGETEPKSNYTWKTYTLCNGSNTTITKYCVNSSYGTVDNKTTLENEDDAVYVATNGEAHMPTHSDIAELMSNTDNTWCTCTVLGEGHETHTVNGRLFTSKTDTTKKIFIPAAGYQGGTSVGNAGINFSVWSSSLYEDGSNNAWSLNSGSGGVYALWNYRGYGYSVRGVK